MKSLNTYKTLSNIDINGKKYVYFDLNKISNQFGIKLDRIPAVTKVFLENLLRYEDKNSFDSKTIVNFCDQINTNKKSVEFSFYPTRVLMQDFTGVPALADLASMRDALNKRKINPTKVNPLSRVDLVIDHSVMVDSYGNINSFKQNVKNEFLRNKERYEFLKWGQNSFNNFYLVPPGAGICHQVNLENISKTVWIQNSQKNSYLFPDSVIGTDSHTTMVNALSVLGWGVGGIEAEASMLGLPISMNFPEVIGFKLIGSLNEGITATDLVLTVTQKLREHGVVGKFIEFFGTGLKSLSLADRATISNMAPEYGATCGYFPTDQETINYLKLSGKDDHHLKVVETYSKIQKLWHDENNSIQYSEIINFDLKKVKASVAGPKRPQDKIILEDVPKIFKKFATKKITVKKSENEVDNGDIVIAAITSCTNTSNPYVMIAAGLLAKKAVEKGLKVKPWVKTSLAPGSKVVNDYLEKSNLSTFLNEIGFNVVGYGCTTCIGNSGPLEKWISEEINKKNLNVCSVLSGNRNFEGRIHQQIKSNFLASPPLVVAFALAGNININLTSEPIGKDDEGNKIFLKDLWPKSNEINELINKSLSKEMYLSRYKKIYKGDENWENIQTSKENIYHWKDSSTYIKSPPFIDENINYFAQDIIDARILAILGDSITTDHISPAGSINENSPAGEYLLERQINKSNFNSYGSRRGNHEIMVRGTLSNIRIHNEIIPNSEGGITHCFVNDKVMTIYDAAMEYLNNKIPLVIFAGKEYGTGSSRDWAAKGVRLLGVRAVIAESFERIHRSNLVGMGILPLEFTNGDSRNSLEISGNEKINIKDINKIKPKKIIDCSIIGENKNIKIKLMCRIETIKELEYFKAGGILQYVFNSIVEKAS